MIGIHELGPAIALIQAHRATAEAKGARPWDAPGIRSVLTAADGPLPDVMRAFLLAAEDHTLNAPTLEGLRLRWQRPPASAPAPRGVPCHEHPDQTQPCRTCQADADTRAAHHPVDPDFIERVKASLRLPADERRALLADLTGDPR